MATVLLHQPHQPWMERPMLSSLHVKNLGIVAEVNIEFSKGLNIVTGETGAGKSLLIDALSLIRGNRFAANLIGPFGDSSSVTAVFQLPAGHGALELLNRWGLAADEDPLGQSPTTEPLEASSDGTLVIRRICQAGGRTRNYVNDTPVHLRTVVELAAELVDISSQFAGQRLLDERSHLHYLDTYAGSLGLRRDFEQKFAACLNDLQKWTNLQRRRQELLREKGLLEAELADLDAFGPSLEDYQETKATLAQLENIQKIARDIHELSDRIGDPHHGCAANLQWAVRSLNQLSSSYPQHIPESLTSLASSAQLAVDDLSFGLESLLAKWQGLDDENTAPGSGSKASLEQRLERYLELTSRFGVGVGELADHAQTIRERLEELDGLEERISDLSQSILLQITEIVTRAERLSAARQSCVDHLSKRVEHELGQLGMNRAQFGVETHPEDHVSSILLPQVESVQALLREHDALAQSFLRLSKWGAERCRFVIVTNPGSPMGSLREVASGGELSRLMLSIKKVLFADETMSVFVFDEIDTGISGSIAAKVGQKLQDFCNSRQAIVVTHLPQVACFGERHHIVSKSTRKDRTSTQVVLADASQREHEIAKMLSGEKLSAESLAQARRLLADAQGQMGRRSRVSNLKTAPRCEKEANP